MKISAVLLLSITLTFSACELADISGIFISDKTVNQRFEQSMEWNAQNPTQEIIVPTDDYMILSFSDSHVGGTNNLNAFFNNAVTQNAAAAVMVGDLTTGHAKNYAVFQQYLPNPDVLPSFPITGNHDLYFNGWEQFYSRFGSSTYIFTVKTPTVSDLYICLDTGSGTLGNLQLDWMKNVLQNLRPDYRRCIVFTHNNLFRFRHTTSTNPLIEELYVLIDLFAKHQVNMVVTGHDHKQYAQEFGNTTHIVMDALLDGFKNSGYLQLNLKNGVIKYKFVTL